MHNTYICQKIFPNPIANLMNSFIRFFSACFVKRALFSTLLLIQTFTICSWANTSSTESPAPTSTCPAILQHTPQRLQDEKPMPLCQYAGQVILIVNTASYCGFTPQYKGLEALYDQYKPRGFVVLGFPSNDFSQEPDKNSQIADFCENTFGVKFPMFTKTSVKGTSATPLFKQLTQRTQTAPKWNFYKYLISRDGLSIESFNSLTAPDDKAFIAEIEKQLAIKAP